MSEHAVAAQESHKTTDCTNFVQPVVVHWKFKQCDYLTVTVDFTVICCYTDILSRMAVRIFFSLRLI